MEQTWQVTACACVHWQFCGDKTKQTLSFVDLREYPSAYAKRSYTARYMRDVGEMHSSKDSDRIVGVDISRSYDPENQKVFFIFLVYLV